MLQNVMHEMVLHLKSTLLPNVLPLKCLLKWHQVIVNYCSKPIRCLTKPFYILELNYAYTLIFLYMYWCYSLHLSFSFSHPWVVRVYKPTWTTNYLSVNYHRDNLKISNIIPITRNHTRVSSFMSLYQYITWYMSTLHMLTWYMNTLHQYLTWILVSWFTRMIY